jgi:hypothetical protein
MSFLYMLHVLAPCCVNMHAFLVTEDESELAAWTGWLRVNNNPKARVMELWKKKQQKVVCRTFIWKIKSWLMTLFWNGQDTLTKMDTCWLVNNNAEKSLIISLVSNF